MQNCNIINILKCIIICIVADKIAIDCVPERKLDNPKPLRSISTINQNSTSDFFCCWSSLFQEVQSPLPPTPLSRVSMWPLQAFWTNRMLPCDLPRWEVKKPPIHRQISQGTSRWRPWSCKLLLLMQTPPRGSWLCSSHYPSGGF